MNLFIVSRKPTKRKELQIALNPSCILSHKTIDIFTGTNHCFLIEVGRKKEKILKSWGLNHYGQLGHSNHENAYSAKEVEFFRNKNIKSIVGGDAHSMVLLESGEIYVWGKNDENQLGFEDTSLQSDIPILLEGIESKATHIYSSSNYCYAANLEEQRIYSWGFGENFILGNRQQSDNEVKPYLIENEFLKGFVEQISLGNQHVMIAVSSEKTKESLHRAMTNEYEFDYDLAPFMTKTMRKKYEKDESYKSYLSKKKTKAADEKSVASAIPEERSEFSKKHGENTSVNNKEIKTE